MSLEALSDIASLQEPIKSLPNPEKRLQNDVPPPSPSPAKNFPVAVPPPPLSTRQTSFSAKLDISKLFILFVVVIEFVAGLTGHAKSRWKNDCLSGKK
jgi:hypothetical protein